MADEEERVNGDADSRAPATEVAEGIEMTTVDLSSPKSPPAVRSQEKRENGGDARPSSPSKAIFERNERESKLELFEIDPLVNVRGLKSMGGQQQQQPQSSPGDVAVSVGLQRQDPAQQPFFQAKSANLGTVMGVFIPCLQNILGIIFYIRFSWIVGIAGIWHSLVLVSICCTCTFITGLSLSAIATNGAMKGGGPYYLIGRALGPEVGVSIGLCFFLGNAVAGSLNGQ